MENIGGGESGVMCCKLTAAENVEHIFFCEELHKPVSQRLRGIIDGSILAGSLCNTSARTRHNFCGLW